MKRYPQFIGDSLPMQKIYQTIDKVAIFLKNLI